MLDAHCTMMQQISNPIGTRYNNIPSIVVVAVAAAVAAVEYFRIFTLLSLCR